jgi:hypothetical protein
MLERATMIFALATFFFGCAAQAATPFPSVPPQPVSLPLLTVSDTSLGEEGRGEPTVLNMGKEPGPYQAFLHLGGRVAYTKPVEMVGGQEVQVVVENEGKIVEEKEENKVFPKVLEKEKSEAKPLPLDLTITDLFLNLQGRLSVTLANIGESPIPLNIVNIKIFVDGLLKGNYPLESFSEQPFLPPKGNFTLTTPLILTGRHEILAHVELTNEVKESDEERHRLRKTLGGPLAGPDIMVKDLELTEDLELMIILSNAGEADLRKGAIFQIQIFVNDQRISEFDHFISEVIKANFGSRYALAPPYQVGIAGISRVKVSISPELSSDDIRLENNGLEKTFVIFPFKIGPRGGEEFIFSISPLPAQRGGPAEKVRAEARMVGGSSSVMLSFKTPENRKGVITFSGRSPLKAEFPIAYEELQKESVWSVFVTNLSGKKVEGFLIIQHP